MNLFTLGKNVHLHVTKNHLKHRAVPLAALVVTTAMTFPVIFFATQSVWSAAAGVLAALVLAFFDRSLITVAAGACLAVLVVEQLLTVI